MTPFQQHLLNVFVNILVFRSPWNVPQMVKFRHVWTDFLPNFVEGQRHFVFTAINSVTERCRRPELKWIVECTKSLCNVLALHTQLYTTLTVSKESDSLWLGGYVLMLVPSDGSVGRLGFGRISNHAWTAFRKFRQPCSKSLLLSAGSILSVSLHIKFWQSSGKEYHNDLVPTWIYMFPCPFNGNWCLFLFVMC